MDPARSQTLKLLVNLLQSICPLTLQMISVLPYSQRLLAPLEGVPHNFDTHHLLLIKHDAIRDIWILLDTLAGLNATGGSCSDVNYTLRGTIYRVNRVASFFGGSSNAMLEFLGSTGHRWGRASAFMGVF